MFKNRKTSLALVLVRPFVKFVRYTKVQVATEVIVVFFVKGFDLVFFWPVTQLYP